MAVVEVLIGGVAGALLTGGTALALKRRDERAARRAAARLIEDEINRAVHALGLARDGGAQEVAATGAHVDIQAWRDHRLFVAQLLNHDDWVGLMLMYSGILQIPGKFTSYASSGDLGWQAAIDGQLDGMVRMQLRMQRYWE